MDYVNRQRVKVWGQAKVIENNAELNERLRGPDYAAGKVERSILFHIKAWDANCPQHIHNRYPQSQVAPIIERLQARVAELEAKLAHYEGDRR
jgi:uncharacterized protein